MNGAICGFALSSLLLIYYRLFFYIFCAMLSIDNILLCWFCLSLHDKWHPSYSKTNVKDIRRQKIPLPYTDWCVEPLSYGSLWRCYLYVAYLTIQLPDSMDQLLPSVHCCPQYHVPHSVNGFFQVSEDVVKVLLVVYFLHRNWRLNILSVLNLLRRNSTCFIFQRWFLVFGISLCLFSTELYLHD